MAKHTLPNFNSTNPNRLIEWFVSDKYDLKMAIHSNTLHPNEESRVVILENGTSPHKIMESFMSIRQIRYALAAGNYRLA